MRKNKIARMIFNGTLLAVMAVFGVTAYQVSNKKEQIQEVLPLESIQEEKEDSRNAYRGTTFSEVKTDEISETGTNLVKAELEDELIEKRADETEEDAELSILDEELDKNGEIVESVDVSAQGIVDNGPEINFSEDTLMEWPVNGNILIDYSMDQSVYFPTLDQYKLSPAISVQAVEGAPVVSAVNGTVYAIEQKAQTGTTVTMELGNGYQAIYGQLTNLEVAQGDRVEKGTILGYVAAPTKYYCEEGSNLYFAMRKNGEPIDPIVYLP